MIFLQAAARPNGPAAALLELVEIGELELFVSEAGVTVSLGTLIVFRWHISTISGRRKFCVRSEKQNAMLLALDFFCEPNRRIRRNVDLPFPKARFSTPERSSWFIGTEITWAVDPGYQSNGSVGRNLRYRKKLEGKSLEELQAMAVDLRTRIAKRG